MNFEKKCTEFADALIRQGVLYYDWDTGEYIYRDTKKGTGFYTPTQEAKHLAELIKNIHTRIDPKTGIRECVVSVELCNHGCMEGKQIVIENHMRMGRLFLSRDHNNKNKYFILCQCLDKPEVHVVDAHEVEDKIAYITKNHTCQPWGG